MRPPAYLLLPILGTVVLVAVVLGAWLWPEPEVPAHSLPPVAQPASTAVAPAPAPPAFHPPAPRPVARTEPARPAQPPQQQQVAAEPRPVEPEGVPAQPPPPPGAPLQRQIAELPPEKQAEVNQMWLTLRERTAEKALEGIRELERQRDEAQSRGDQVEVDRLEQLIMAQREGVEELRGTRPPKSYPSRFAPGVPEQPPRQ